MSAVSAETLLSLLAAICFFSFLFCHNELVNAWNFGVSVRRGIYGRICGRNTFQGIKRIVSKLIDARAGRGFNFVQPAIQCRKLIFIAVDTLQRRSDCLDIFSIASSRVLYSSFIG